MYSGSRFGRSKASTIDPDIGIVRILSGCTFSPIKAPNLPPHSKKMSKKWLLLCLGCCVLGGGGLTNSSRKLRLIFFLRPGGAGAPTAPPDYAYGSRDLAHPFPDFHRGSKSAKFGVVYITQLWAVRVWKCSKISEFSNKSAMLRWSPYVLAKFGEV